jgi:hypothetical protein
MPRPGDPYANAYIAEHMKCWRMIHDRQGQAAHCLETPTWTGRWFARQGSGGGGSGRVSTTSRA